jgi:hypothetical protein
MNKKYIITIFSSLALLLSQNALGNNEQFIDDFKSHFVNKTISAIERDNKHFATKDITIDLNNPSYHEGILSTNEGGVVKGKDIRIQAKSITYINNLNQDPPEHLLEACGEIMVQYKHKIYTGSSIKYDFITNTGIIEDGKTYVAPFYFGGKTIKLHPDGSYSIENVTMTTCENSASAWCIHANSAEVSNTGGLKANNIFFKCFNIPTLWLPYYRSNLNKYASSPAVRYNITWDRGAGPRASMRYKLYSWRDFALFGRLDYRFTRGFGGAIETEYFSKTGNNNFVTKNYLATDVLPNDPRKKKRYRIQGKYDGITPDKKTTATVSWDKYSDIHMPSDFVSDDFAINTAKMSQLIVRHQEENNIASLYARPRLNTFESFKQELPTIFTSIKPFQFKNCKIVVNNFSTISYLDFLYPKGVPVSDMHSLRLESCLDIYRAFHLYNINITPTIGVIAIGYSNIPSHYNKYCQGIIKYGGNIQTEIFHNYANIRHVIQPYANYIGLTRPTIGVNGHYIFSINDGYNTINMVKVGVNNSWITLKNKNLLTDVDLYLNAFINKKTFNSFIPRIYCDINTNLSRMFLKLSNAWNFLHQTWDYSNTVLGWTANDNFAMTVEFRYRSSYSWRKANIDNFIVDVTRSDREIRNSPLSDKRNTILSNVFFRLTPYWTCHLESHHGWNRFHEPPYNEYKIHLNTFLSTGWKLAIAYEHTQTDDRVTISMSLMKKRKEIPLF